VTDKPPATDKSGKSEDTPPPGPAAADRPARRRLRAEAAYALEILALCGLAVTQPVLDVTGQSPDFFLFHGATRLDIIALVAVVVVVPPLALWGTGALLGLAGSRVRRIAHVVTVAVLVAALAVQVGKHLLPLRGIPLTLAAVAVAAGTTYAYVRWRVPGQLLRVAAAGPVVFIALFALMSPVSAVVLPGGDARAEVGVAKADATGHPPVVMLVLDEFPLTSLLGADGTIDAERYPNFAALAAGSTWYRNATGVSGWTPYALPAMLSGRYPQRTVAPHYAAYPDNLFTLLGGLYDMDVQESITELCPPSECDRARRDRGGLPVLLGETAGLLGQIASPRDEPARDPEASYREATLAEAADAFEPTDARFRWDTLDDNQPARFTAFLSGLVPRPAPTLHLLHLLMPHTPWNYLPSGTRYDAPENFSLDNAGWVETARQRHLAQVGYTDKLIGEMLARLKDTGLYDRAVLVVTADHGVSFTRGSQGRGMAAVESAPEEVLWVPTFVKTPGQRAGAVDDRNWQHVDLLPTVADLAGVDVPWPTDGVSALSGRRDRSDRTYADEPGKAVTIDGRQPFANILAGRGGPPPVLPALPDLVGQKPQTAQTAAEPARIDNLDDFAGVDPAGGTLPALVYGDVPDEFPVGTPLAVAVNGTVGAVTRVGFTDRQGRRFAALVEDEGLFVVGANRLDLYAVTGGGLVRIPVR
jgi:hypothetical protein